MALSPRVEKAKSVQITKEDAFEFFSDRDIATGCEVCTAADWAVSTEYKVSYVPAVLATCRNCGNMRLHSLIVLQLWKEDREAK